MVAVTMPERSTVNGLSIAGWYIVGKEDQQMEPAFYCEACILKQVRDVESEAVPLYRINTDGSEYCDSCLGSLDN